MRLFLKMDIQNDFHNIVMMILFKIYLINKLNTLRFGGGGKGIKGTIHCSSFRSFHSIKGIEFNFFH
jgi:hypothetical protein